METLVNKHNPSIRITAPEIKIGSTAQYGRYFRVPRLLDYFWETGWILVEKEQKPAEDWREKRKKECPFRKNLDNNLYGCERYAGLISGCTGICSWVVDYPKLKEIQDRMSYCIEYINPQYPLLDNGELNIRHLRVPDEHSAEMALTLMLSLGAKIYKLYRGNVKDGKLAEWPTPMIVDTDDWYSIDWLHNILD